MRFPPLIRSVVRECPLNLWWFMVTLGVVGRLTAADPLPARADGPTNPMASHWAFQPVREPNPPKVVRSDWVQTPVDAFILSQLESHQLQPAAPASKRALLRRLSLDLTGLPPGIEELDQFASDESPHAYSREVERLLNSPRYGERWGRYWLDVARYADTKGYVFYYEESQFVQPYRYRDWVIRAFNTDMPYDRFLQYQIAADQLVLDPSETRVATTKIHATTADPFHTVGHPDLAALGFLTLGRRFLGNPHDIIDDQLDVLIRGTQGLTIGCARCHDHKFDPVSMADYYSLYGLLQSSQERLMPLANGPTQDAWMPFSEAQKRIEFDRELRARVEKLEASFKSACDQVAERLRGRTLDYLVTLTDRDRLPTLSANVRPSPDDINPYNVRQWDLYLKQRANDSDPVFCLWHQFAALKPEEFNTRGVELFEAFRNGAPPFRDGPKLNSVIAAAFTSPPDSMKAVAQLYGQTLLNVHQEWKLALGSARTNKTAEPKALKNPADEQLRQVLYGAGSPVLAPNGSMVELDVHLYFDDPNRVALSKQQMEIEQWINSAPNAPAHTVALADRPEPINGRIFPRGDPSKAGREVPRRFLNALGGSDSKPFQIGSGRLELAQAIAHRDNPLTARVMVNRVWAHHFGVGLVPTQSDFGARSESPSHPELLDWLASHFVEEGWSIKQLHRWIVLSSTYQQDSTPAQARAETVDPANRWLHRFPRQRLDFEALRDSILFATGELDLRMGEKAFDLEAEPTVARRTVYGRVDRKYLPAVLRSFDFANPDLHSPQRHTTTVPQQALYFLNSPWLANRARALSRRASIACETPSNSSEFLTHLYRCVHQRKPTPREHELGLRFLQSAQPGASAGLTATEQLAQVLLFSNELAHSE